MCVYVWEESPQSCSSSCNVAGAVVLLSELNLRPEWEEMAVVLLWFIDWQTVQDRNHVTISSHREGPSAPKE